MECGHIPVMLQEVIAGIAPRSGGIYLDGTLGLGGHAGAILAASEGSQICGIDQDGDALARANKNLEAFGSRAHLFQMHYADFPEALEKLGWSRVNGALLDLGVSSLQLDVPQRGFSFRANGPLDMRMNQKSGERSAWHLVNQGSHAELRDCFAILGEDPQAGRIARSIVDAREKGSIDDTATLSDIVWRAYPPAWRKSARRHPATRAFQALRMAVNDELGQLAQFLARIPDWLAPGARLVVISFHSLEDRLVKQAIRRWAKEDMKSLYKKPLQPSAQEVADNPRASSAKLRIVEKL